MVKVEELIRGQAEIDRMRQETKQVVNMICGAVKSLELRPGIDNGYGFSLKSHGADYWDICPTHDGLMVTCVIDIGGGNWQFVFRNICNMEVVKPDVSAAHNLLQYFVDGMIDAYPGLEEMLQPYVTASR